MATDVVSSTKCAESQNADLSGTVLTNGSYYCYSHCQIQDSKASSSKTLDSLDFIFVLSGLFMFPFSPHPLSALLMPSSLTAHPVSEKQLDVFLSGLIVDKSQVLVLLADE